MYDLQEISCLIYDYGNYFSIAERLSRPDGFGTVYYYCPYVYNGYPDHRPISIGNYSSVIRVKEWASIINEVQLVVFPESHEPLLQEYFSSIGKSVFGSKTAGDLEHDRYFTKQLMESLGLNINPYQVAHGIDELESILQYKDNAYIKSSLRGDMETWFHQNYELSKMELNRIRNNMGTYGNKEIYIIEDSIDSIAEIGLDTICVDGKYMMESLCGIELKDTGYYGCIIPYAELPLQLRLVTDKFSEEFSYRKYRGFHSNEVIISSSNRGYLIDLTQRLPQPPGDLMLEMYDNFPEMIFETAIGVVPRPRYIYRHGVQFIVKSETARTDPSPIIVPIEFQRYVKVKNMSVGDDGLWYYTPMGVEMTEIASVIGMGNSMEEAVQMATMISESIKGFDIKINTDCIGQAKEQMDRLSKAGISYI